MKIINKVEILGTATNVILEHDEPAPSDDGVIEFKLPKEAGQLLTEEEIDGKIEESAGAGVETSKKYIDSDSDSIKDGFVDVNHNFGTNFVRVDLINDLGEGVYTKYEPRDLNTTKVYMGNVVLEEGVQWYVCVTKLPEPEE